MRAVVLYLLLTCWKLTYCRTPYGRDVHDSTFAFKHEYHNLDGTDTSLKQTEASTENSVKTFSPLKPPKLQNSLQEKNEHPSFKSHKHLNGAEHKYLSTEMGKFSVKVLSALHPEDQGFIVKGTEILPVSKYHHFIEILPNREDPESMEDKIVDKIAAEETTIANQPKKPLEDLLEVDKSVEALQDNSEKSTIDNTKLEGNVPLIGSEEDTNFSDEFQSSGEEAFNSQDSETDNDDKSGRLLSMFSRDNNTAPLCLTPKNETGRCLRFRHCLLSSVLNNFNDFLQYLCLIRGALVGVCCPDNPVIEITDPDDNTTESEAKREIKQPPEGCGLNTKTRIVGGTISVPHEWSWMVALMRRNRFYCGGVIINNWYILTAAHCVMGINVKDLTVRLGEYNFSERNEHQEDFSVAEIKRHAQFVTLTFQHDIALLKLKRSIQYTKFVGSICLPTQASMNYSGVDATVVGWGTVSFGGAASPVLRQVTIPVWKNEDCDKTYRLESIGDAFLCAGNPEKGEDACQGDSGGPLMAVNERGRWEVIGIVSWGRRCGDPTYPGVYTRITTYLDWIAQNAV